MFRDHIGQIFVGLVAEPLVEVFEIGDFVFHCMSLQSRIIFRQTGSSKACA